MKKCALCQSNEANQTGSHIYTYSLIKTAINEAGKIVRDKELSFSLNVLDFGNVYFGRKVQPEKIEEVLGKAITEEDIKNNENHYTVDYLVCGNCEKRFTIAENYFISNVHQKLQQSKFKTKPDSKKNSIIDLPENELDLDLIRLFIYMQIWRASAARYNGFRLKPKLEKQLRRILDENLDWDLDFKKTIANCRKNSHEIRKYPLSITFCETDIKTENKFELTTNVVVTTNSKIPYFFVLNDIYVQFYAKESHIKSSIDYLFGLNDIIPKKEHININEKSFVIGVLDDVQRKALINSFYINRSQAIRRKLRITYRITHTQILGVKPSYLETEYVVNSALVIPNKDVKNLIEILATHLKQKIIALGIPIHEETSNTK